MVEVEPVAEGSPAPRARAMGSDRRSGILLVEGVDPADLFGNPRRRVAQDEARDPLRICRGEQQSDDPSGGFPDPVDS